MSPPNENASQALVTRLVTSHSYARPAADENSDIEESFREAQTKEGCEDGSCLEQGRRNYQTPEGNVTNNFTEFGKHCNFFVQSLVVACGTRKVWSKLFQDLDTPQQQIKKLKEMLADLGMTGRLSLEQAKAIKEKRELEKELGA